MSAADEPETRTPRATAQFSGVRFSPHARNARDGARRACCAAIIRG
jgi:hypothetical protein